MRFHHIGIAASEPEKAIAFVRGGWDVTHEDGPVHDPLQDADLFMLTLRDGARIEIVSGKRVEAFIKRGEVIFHTCYEVDDIEAAAARLRKAGALVISPPRPAVLFGGRRVTFLQTKIGLVELLEAAR
jgi:methylmalonyl-CoA/ethylmalonyl-CoA epimerase